MSHKIKKFSTKFDDLGVIIMGNRCSFQQSEENNFWFEQSPESSTVSTVPLISGPPGILKTFVGQQIYTLNPVWYGQISNGEML